MLTPNKALCTLCDDVIESRYRHDFVSCKGGHFFLDGGNDYQRYGALKEGVLMSALVFLDE